MLFVPDKILAAYARQLNTGGLIVSYPLRPIWSYEDYARIALKDLNTFPQYFFYDGHFLLGMFIFGLFRPISLKSIWLLTPYSTKN